MFLGIGWLFSEDSDCKESCKSNEQPVRTEFTRTSRQSAQLHLRMYLVKHISYYSGWWNPLIGSKMKFLRLCNMFLGMTEYSNIPFTFEDLKGMES